MAKQIPRRKPERRDGEEGRPDAPRRDMVQVAVRMSTPVVHALKRLVLDNQIAGKPPTSQQGVIEAALVDYLRARGYLK